MTMLEKLVLPEIRELIRAKDWATLREILGEWLQPDLAALISDLEPDEQALVFRAFEGSAAAALFGYLDFAEQEHLAESLPVGEVVKILNGMRPTIARAFSRICRPTICIGCCRCWRRKSDKSRPRCWPIPRKASVV